MTQPPPPPPNQPPDPQGGFGAPTPPQQPPQEPGYGYPQQPPADPGYGYPQQPPAQPPYGYPAQPQPQQPQQYGGYQPQQPVQPPYGYPTQPQQPYGGYPGTVQAPVAAPGGKKLSAQLQIVIAAVVAVVLIVGVGIWYANSESGGGKDGEAKSSAGTSQGTSQGGSGGSGESKGTGGGGSEKPPADTQAKLTFQVPKPAVPDVTDVSGSWITDKAYVKTGINSIVGYDLAKGTPLWTLPLVGQICGVSRHVTADNKLPILFEASKRVAPRYYQQCTEVGLVDLDAGKLLWSTSITGGSAGDQKARFGEITVSGKTVAAGGNDGGAAFDVANGNPRWKPQVSDQNCYDMGYGGGAGLVAVRKCGPYDSQYVLIQNIDPMTGAPVSQYKMPTGVKYASIVSTKPLVVAADVGDSADDGSGISDFFSLDEKTGKLKAKITADADQYAGRCRSTKVESCTKVVVNGNRLYVPTEEHEGSTGEYGDETNELIAFDLTTGRTAPEKADAGDKYTLVPLRMDGGDIIAYKSPPYDKGGRIVAINGVTMKETLLLENPADPSINDIENSFSPDYSEILYRDGRLFMSAMMLSKPRASASPDDKEPLVVSYSTK
ncbi:PQQ-binding-like beta-propeller repeat protein [Streptomyces sp. NBC_00094]|uniref:outer membrane protein assembly factor BamB family protein n=1 Tax=Streptomyces sp. NBC_00094 TaxID=2903620 RepID=UPI0022554508|nr:PQQ-binding-like beta-propeller repeat protein [Streptomyces sp. NBC_00094]MCX5391204.1 PQQ-like beta-propeller repeat protein [Streptomyces sp. NBC_00094]